MRSPLFHQLISLPRFLFVVVLISTPCISALSQSSGSIAGIVKDDDNRETIPYVNILVKGTSFGAASDENGRYSISNLPPGTYELRASAVGFKPREVTIKVDAGSEISQDFYLVHSTVELSEVLVYGASLRRERITEAPASVSIVEAKDIARNGGHGQLPKLLEAEPGIDMVQSGLFDFNVNTRGFNSSLNRRLLILLDGRDLGTAFLGATEWNGLSIPLEELGRIELVRGPGSALYGANAYNGVMNITSIPPRAALGTKAIVGVGELSMFRGDVRHADAIDRWSYRINLGAISGKTFSKVRTGQKFEYSGFHPLFNDEVKDLNTAPVRNMYASARLDYDYQDGDIATIEGGIAQVENEVIVTGIGRVQVQKAQRPWARVSYSGHGVNVVAWTSGRKNLEPEVSLATGLSLYQDALISQGEAQYSFSIFESRLFAVVGASQRFVDVGTKGTLMLETRHDNMTGVYAQMEYRFTPTLKGLFAARWDRSTLHPSQFSPKAAVVWSFLEGHSVRATFNRAFQSPNYSELFLHVKHPTRPLAYYGNMVENPQGLSGFVGGAQPGPLKDMTVEKIISYEIGYKGVFANSLFLTIDTYFSELTDFVTDLAVGVNPRFPITGGIYPNDPIPTRTIWSYVNAGRAQEVGLEVGANYYFSERWFFRVNYSLYSFEVLEKNLNDVLIPNSPNFRVGGGLTYSHPDGHDLGLNMKYVPTFDWAAGIFQGKIPAYTVMDLSGSYVFTKQFSVTLNVSNLLDREHYQIFGGSILGRRTVVTAAYSW
ncbi:MAG: TonB-dependent receptor [Ignavibacteriales bacterium]|nr:TonB-dependent receptor [Ignavibacteriales bacterium]